MYFYLFNNNFYPHSSFSVGCAGSEGMSYILQIYRYYFDFLCFFEIFLFDGLLDVSI